MKTLFAVVMSFLLAQSSWALAPYGKYKLELYDEVGGFSGTYEFLVNSNAEVTMLSDKYDGYNLSRFKLDNFFDIYTFNVKWGSDGEYHYFTFDLENKNYNTSISKQCALYVDRVNEQSDTTLSSFTLSRWNKAKKAYEVLKEPKPDNKCLNELEKKYLTF